jgi:DNA-binding XRE family transcriptional regulator
VTEQPARPPHEHIEVLPVVVLSQTFPARPSSIPEIRDFVQRGLADSPLTERENQDVRETVFRALLDAAGPTGTIQVSFRIYPEEVEVDVLRSDPGLPTHPSPRALMQSLPLAGRPGPAPVAPESASIPVVPVRTDAPVDEEPAAVSTAIVDDTFAEWMSSVLRREGLTQEAAARQLGVSVKTVGRWVGGETEPRLRDLRRIKDLFGELPFPS